MSSLLPLTLVCILNWSLLSVIILESLLVSTFKSYQLKLAILGLIALLIGIPFFGSPLAYYPRSLFGDFSISMTVAMLLITLQPSKTDSVTTQQFSSLAAIVIAFGIILYPATLGLSMTDPYQWGYNPRIMIAITGVVCVALWVANKWLAATTLTLATAGFLFNVLESTNYWDYLVDPVFFIFSLTFVVKKCFWKRSQSIPVAEH